MRTIDEERLGGTLTLADREWSWEASVLPPREDAPAPLLRWHEFVFRLRSDPEQEARVRAGLPPEEWSEGTLRHVLRGARSRTWRDAEGKLWSVTRTGWPSSVGGTAKLAEGEAAAGVLLVFRPLGGSEEPEERNLASEPPPLAEATDEALQALLEGGGAPSGGK